MAKKKPNQRRRAPRPAELSSTSKTPSRSPSERAIQRFPVVGIGASAGGVEAIIEFFSAMKADSGMGFVVVPHLGPGHKSALPEILAKVTRTPIAEARDGLSVEPNHIYVLPPNTEMVIVKGILHRRARQPCRQPPSTSS